VSLDFDADLDVAARLAALAPSSHNCQPWALAHLESREAREQAAALLGACGVRGPLEPPTQAQTQGEKTKSAEAGAAGENSAAKPKPHEDFILDPLLR